MTNRRSYLDHNATSPLRPEAGKAMEAGFAVGGNPSSVHREGQRARAVVEEARVEVAAAFGVGPTSIVFTSGASEAANLALSPGILAGGRSQPLDHLLVSAVEHPCFLAGGRFSEQQTERLSVDREGRLDLADFERALVARTRHGGRPLVAVMLANNETGVIQPVAEAARLAHAHGGYLVCDGVQAVGRMAVDITALGADFLIVSSHKLGGPMGVGALVLADPGLVPAPALTGGGQERGLRSGTENVPAIAGFAAALSVAMRGAADEAARLGRLRSMLEASVAEATPNAIVIGGDAPRLANTAAIALPGARAETLVIGLDLEGIAVSAGAACSSGKVARSHVLEAMGHGARISDSTIRASLGWSSEEADIARFAAAWKKVTSQVSTSVAA